MVYANEMPQGQFPCKCALMKGGEPFMNHCHGEWEIIKIREGSLRVTEEGESHLLKAGDIWMAPPFASHSIEGGSEDSARLVVLMEPRLMGIAEMDQCQWLDIQGLLEHSDLKSRSWPVSAKASLDAIVEEIYHELSQKEYGWQLAVKALADQMLLYILRDVPRCEEKSRNPQAQRLREILEYISRNYCGPITLRDCARVAGFNPTYFSRYFKGCMGMTFQQYVKRLRIDRAKWLLQADDGFITEICFQCGYRDIKTFNKLFKQETGLSPTQFRRERKGK